MGALASINVIFSADLKQFSSEIQNASRELKKVGKQMQSIGNTLSIGVTLPVIAAGTASIKMASDYTESLNKVDVAFKASSSQVQEFAKTSLQSFGIAEGTALDMASTYGDMATSMGLSTSASAKMATSLVGLAGDLASFKNVSIDVANTAISSIFTGETESIKKLGIVMTEANLQQFAYSKGINVQIKDMDQASKVNLRYAYVMANTTNAQGDFVRTGGGAANQMRIFQELLKQLGQQFGAIILPAFIKAISYINGMIQSFGNLSDGTKSTIIVVAGLAAAIGPLLTASGKLLTFLPDLAAKFNTLKTAFSELQTYITANPYIALAAAIGLVAGGLYLWFSNQKQVVTSQQALNTAIAEGNKQAQSEVGTLDSLYKTATNVKLSINERKKAVDELQSVYPAYFKNIKDEAILNGNASASYKQLREDIFNKARAMAVEGEINRRATERVGQETKLREDILNTEKEIQKIRKGADVVVLQEANAIEKTSQVTATKTDLITAQYELLKIQRGKLSQFNKDALKEDEALLLAKQEFGSKTGQLAQNEIDKQKEIKIGAEAVADANKKIIKVGTIEYFQAQIDGLQKLQKEQATTNTEWLKYQNAIDGVQKKIDAFKNTGIKLPKPTFDMSTPEAPPAFSLQDLSDQKSFYEQQQKTFSTTTDEFQKYADLINNTQIKIDTITGADEAMLTIDNVKSKLQEFSDKVNETMINAIQSFSEGFGGVIASWTQGGNLLSGIGNLFLTTLGDMMIQIGKIAIETGIAIGAIKKALMTLNPIVAIGAGVALIALGTIVKSQVANAGSYADGGIVPGSSYSGDKLFAAVNSGEMILNKKQQNNLASMINPAVTSGDVAIQLMGGFEIEGTKLRLVLDRTDKKKNRIG